MDQLPPVREVVVASSAVGCDSSGSIPTIGRTSIMSLPKARCLHRCQLTYQRQHITSGVHQRGICTSRTFNHLGCTSRASALAGRLTLRESPGMAAVCSSRTPNANMSGAHLRVAAVGGFGTPSSTRPARKYSHICEICAQMSDNETNTIRCRRTLNP